MCGRFTLTSPDRDLAIQFDLPSIQSLEPRYNVAPTQAVAAVREAPDGAGRELAMLQWGLIPFWAKDPAIGSRMINARAETVAEKPAFRAAFRRRRCLVLADGFYEWQKQNGGKQPYYIRLHDGRPFGIAGLWEHWEGRDGDVIQSCTLLTTQPNELLKPLHNRMPVILEPDRYDQWLDRSIDQPEVLRPLLGPFAEASMDAYPVSRWVNHPGNEGPQCIEPLPEAPDGRLPGI